jgi:hypothetical protein
MRGKDDNLPGTPVMVCHSSLDLPVRTEISDGCEVRAGKSVCEAVVLRAEPVRVNVDVMGSGE